MGLLVHGRLTRLRQAGDGDVDRLVAWLADPEIARYWDDETFTHGEMTARLARGDVAAWIVETADGEPIGYLQVHETGLDMEQGGDPRLGARRPRGGVARPPAGRGPFDDLGADGVPFISMSARRTSTPR